MASNDGSGIGAVIQCSDMLPRAIRYCGLEALLILRAVGRLPLAAVDSPPPCSAWHTVPPSVRPENVSRPSYATLAAINERRCCVCMRAYRGRVDACFGTYTHPDCRRNETRNTYYATTSVDGLPTECLTGYNRGNGGEYAYDVVWWSPHWCIPRQHTVGGVDDASRATEAARITSRKRLQASLQARRAAEQADYDAPAAVAKRDALKRKRESLLDRRTLARDDRVETVTALLGPECVHRLILIAVPIPRVVAFRNLWIELSSLTLKNPVAHVDWSRAAADATEALNERHESIRMRDEENRCRAANQHLRRQQLYALAARDPIAAAVAWPAPLGVKLRARCDCDDPCRVPVADILRFRFVDQTDSLRLPPTCNYMRKMSHHFAASLDLTTISSGHPRAVVIFRPIALYIF